jgi:hypothetical protein
MHFSPSFSSAKLVNSWCLDVRTVVLVDSAYYEVASALFCNIPLRYENISVYGAMLFVPLFNKLCLISFKVSGEREAVSGSNRRIKADLSLLVK